MSERNCTKSQGNRKVSDMGEAAKCLFKLKIEVNIEHIMIYINF